MTRAHSYTIAFIFILLTTIIAATPALAGPGDLDTSFGILGQLKDSTIDYVRGSVVQPDGKIVVVGYKASKAAVVRYNVDGSVDHSFGTAGLVLAGPAYSFFFAAALQEDGKIVAAGRNEDGNAFVVRLNTNGTFDTSFSGDGKLSVLYVRDYYYSEFTSVAIVPNTDDLVLAGTIYYDTVDYPCDEGTDIIMARLNSNGTYDSTLGGTGKKRLDLSCRDILTSIAIHPTNRKIAFTVEGSGDFEVGMLNEDGSFDTSFGGNGMVETDFNGTTYSHDRATSVAFQRWLVPVGGFPAYTTRLVVGGTAYGSSVTVYDWALARYKLDGSLDTAFDDDGKVRKSLSYQYESVEALKIDSQQRIVTTGRRTWNNNNDFALVRFTRDGEFDTTFGNGGKVYTPFYIGDVRVTSVPYAVAFAPDGKIVVAGNGTELDALIARYEQ